MKTETKEHPNTTRARERREDIAAALREVESAELAVRIRKLPNYGRYARSADEDGLIEVRTRSRALRRGRGRMISKTTEPWGWTTSSGPTAGGKHRRGEA
jgi:hypothetical protein